MSRCSACGVDNPEGARYCNACGASLTGAALAREERKVVTVVFADLVGFTSRSERLDPEDVRALQRPYFARLREEFERYGGTVEKFIGDAVMAVFGAPVGHEDDPERAVRAALAIRDAIAETDLQVRIAVATGEALVALDARATEGESIVAGDVVNIAARLQTAAPPNGILVLDSTYRATAQAIEYRDVERVSARGKSEPIPAWEAVAPRARLGVDVQQRGPTRLIGRSRELELLAGALERARAERESQLVTVMGVPGIGKSRLVYELLRVVHDEPELIFWRQGRCLPYGDGVAFWALAEIVKAQLGVLDTDTADEVETKLLTALAGVDETEWLASHLRPLLGLGASPGESADAFAAWRSYLETLAERNPLVLVFEDLHWADDSLLDFVEHVADWARGVPILVLCTARPELLERRPRWGGGKLNALTLALSSLSEDETSELIAALVESSLLSGDARAALVQRAGGNPLYAEQFVRMLGEGGGSELPETVQGIIAARLDALPADEKALLQDAAVMGKVFWPGALGHTDAELLLHALERKQFVRRERRSSVGGEVEYAFRHVLVGDVAYGQIPRAERAEKHRRVAAWIDSLSERNDGTVEMLAHHYVAALELVRATGGDDADLLDKARYALRDAANRAYELGALATALRLYERALELWPDDDERPQIEFSAVRASAQLDLGALGLSERWKRVQQQLLAVGDVEHAAEACIGLSRLLHVGGDPAAARSTLENGLSWLSDRPDSRSTAVVLSVLCSRAVMAGDYEDGLRFGERALQVADALGESTIAADALTMYGIGRMGLGDFDGLADLERSVALLREQKSHNLGLALSNVGAALCELVGDVRAAKDHFDEGLEVCERFGLAWVHDQIVLQLILSAYWLGDWNASLAHGEYLAGRETEVRTYQRPFILAFRSRVSYARGDRGRAVADSELGLELASAIGDDQMLTPALAWHARIAGSAKAADKVLEKWRTAGGHGGVAYFLVDLAVALLELGREAEFLEAAEAMPSRSMWQTAASAVARRDFRAAADVFDHIGSLPDAAWARLQAGECEPAQLFYDAVGADPSSLASPQHGRRGSDLRG